MKLEELFDNLPDEVYLLVPRFFAILHKQDLTMHEIYCHIKPNILHRYGNKWDLDGLSADQLKEAIGLLRDVKGNGLLEEPDYSIKK